MRKKPCKLALAYNCMYAMIDNREFYASVKINRKSRASQWIDVTIGGFSSRVFCERVHEGTVHFTLHKTRDLQPSEMTVCPSYYFHFSSLFTPLVRSHFFSSCALAIPYIDIDTAMKDNIMVRRNFDITLSSRSLFIADVSDIKNDRYIQDTLRLVGLLRLKRYRANRPWFSVFFRDFSNFSAILRIFTSRVKTVFSLWTILFGELDAERIGCLTSTWNPYSPIKNSRR